jgi:protocatechuate 3,4-dioxygenase beta subunit
MEERRVTRRGLIGGAAAVPLVVALAACGDDPAPAPTTAATPAEPDTAATTLTPTPACDDHDEPTVEQTEGPYFKPSSPERSSLLADGMAGTRLVVMGAVVSSECAPIKGALLDFWQANDAGEYNNTGFTLRGHQFTDARGRFRLTTIVPGLYTGRTRHIHVKVQKPHGSVLTTQLYFPGEPQNASDGIFDESLLMDVKAGPGGRRDARFDFVLA